MPKSRANQTGFNIRILHFYIRRKLDIIRYNIFQYGLEPLLIQRILFGFEAILEMNLHEVEYSKSKHNPSSNDNNQSHVIQHLVTINLTIGGLKNKFFKKINR